MTTKPATPGTPATGWTAERRRRQAELICLEAVEAGHRAHAWRQGHHVEERLQGRAMEPGENCPTCRMISVNP